MGQEGAIVWEESDVDELHLPVKKGGYWYFTISKSLRDCWVIQRKFVPYGAGNTGCSTDHEDMNPDEIMDDYPSECPKCHSNTVMRADGGWKCSNENCDFDYPWEG